MSDEQEATTADDSTDEEDAIVAQHESNSTSSDSDSNEERASEEAEDDDEPSTADDDTPDNGHEKESGEGLEEGDFVRINFTARTVDTDRLVDTTDEVVAEEEDVDTDEQAFEPRVIALGAGHIFQSVEEDIYGKTPGDEGSVIVPAVEAFGEYDSEKVRTVSADTIPEDNRYPGAHVDIDGQHGHLETIIGGRARVDFNHPLAGEDIKYEYEILEKVEDPIEKANGFLRMLVDADLTMWIQTDVEEQPVETESDEENETAEATNEEESETEQVELETLYIESIPQLALNQQWLFQKRQIAQELIERLNIDRVVVQETIDGTGGLFGDGDIGTDFEGDDHAFDDVEIDAEEIESAIEDEADDSTASD